MRQLAVFVFASIVAGFQSTSVAAQGILSIPRCILTSIAFFVTLGSSSPAWAVDFFWVGPGLGGPGGNFRTAGNWTFTPPPFPLEPAPGGEGDTANFDLGRAPENRYTVTNVNGENDQMLIHDDSFRLDVGDYQLLSVDEENPSFIVGVTSGDEANVILRGVGAASLRTKDAVLGLGVASVGEVTVDHLQWQVDGLLSVGGSGGSGDGYLTILNGSLMESDVAGIGRAMGSIGEVVVSDSSWTVDQGIGIGSGIQGSGTLTVRNGGTVFSRSGASSSGAVLVEGPGSTWSMADFLSIFFASGATVTIRDGGTVIVGSDGTGPLTGNSSAVVTLDSDGVLDVRDTIDMNSGDFNYLGGTLHVENFEDHLVNQGGTLAPGNQDQPVGSTNITGNYTHQSAATLQFDIAGTIAGVQHDFVNVEGTALLAGELDLVLIDPYEPGPDDEFTVFNTESLLLGSFSNVASGQRLATSDGLGSFLVHYGPTSTFNANQVVLSDFLPGVLGDYNNNGTVDAADYVLWRKGGPLSNEVDTPGTVNAADYTAWRARFGNPGFGAGAGVDFAAVPEPTMLVMLILAAAGWCLRRGRTA